MRRREDGEGDGEGDEKRDGEKNGGRKSEQSEEREMTMEHLGRIIPLPHSLWVGEICLTGELRRKWTGLMTKF
jgi:hypothetical protein